MQKVLFALILGLVATLAPAQTAAPAPDSADLWFQQAVGVYQTLNVDLAAVTDAAGAAAAFQKAALAARSLKLAPRFAVLSAADGWAVPETWASVAADFSGSVQIAMQWFDDKKLQAAMDAFAKALGELQVE